MITTFLVADQLKQTYFRRIPEILTKHWEDCLKAKGDERCTGHD
jgi:hypothetical protein